METVLIPALIVMVGWIVSHQLAAWRDRTNKRREQRVSYLIGAFRSLSLASHHPRLYEVAGEVERAIADIQFLGNGEQIKAAQEFSTSMVNNQEANLDPLLKALRNELRKDLGRKPYNGPIMWLRISRMESPEQVNGEGLGSASASPSSSSSRYAQ